jgi:hypothetical protein
MPLLRTRGGIDDFVAGDAELPAFDLHAPLGSLPRLLGTTVETAPCEVPYLQADPDLLAEWKRELADIAGLRVAIVWQGGKGYGLDHFRSFPLSQIAALADVPGVRLISLQKHAGHEQLADCDRRGKILDLGPRLDEGGGAFLDTVAVLKQVDLLISCDTAVAHLAGALDVPVWLALDAASDWRWLSQREDTLWYPRTRLFRQKQLGQWAPVFERMSAELAPLAAAKAAD